jgi:hypothetical protein
VVLENQDRYDPAASGEKSLVVGAVVYVLSLDIDVKRESKSAWNEHCCC